MPAQLPESISSEIPAKATQHSITTPCKEGPASPRGQEPENCTCPFPRPGAAHAAPGWPEIRGARHGEAWSSLSCRRVGCKSKTPAPPAPNFFKGRAKPFLTSADRPQTAKGDISQSCLSFTLLAFSLVTTWWRRKLGRRSGPARSPAGPAVGTQAQPRQGAGSKDAPRCRGARCFQTTAGAPLVKLLQNLPLKGNFKGDSKDKLLPEDATGLFLLTARRAAAQSHASTAAGLA